MAWPGRDLVPDRLIVEARSGHVHVARELSRFEEVLVLAYPGFGRQAEIACGPSVEVMEIPLGTAWIRDSGPLFAIREGELVAVDFQFNSWGSTLPPYVGSVGARLARRLRVPRQPVPFVLEGGSISVDGAGTLLALEASILNDNRNPGATKEPLEDVFRRSLGAERTVWLPHGLIDDRTGGHMDNVAAFVGPGRVLCQAVGDDDPNSGRLAQNRTALVAAGLEVIDFDVPPSPIRYLNFYIGNGCVIVPVAGSSNDRRALALLREVFPDRAIVGVPGHALVNGGGGVHCITQQIPVARAY